MRLTTDLLFPIRASYGAKVIPQLPGMVGRSEFRIRAGSHDDIEWVVRRHREIYSDEYGWDSRFGDLVAGIASDFVRDLDPLKERCWIAERRGERIGCVFLVRNKDETAQLRLLLVEPSARGLGVGASLVRKCIDFARASGYERLRLWTNDVLHSARRIYEAAGFRLVEESSMTAGANRSPRRRGSSISWPRQTDEPTARPTARPENRQPPRNVPSRARYPCMPPPPNPATSPAAYRPATG
jgi:GNAT superfamily N-acetyltransferase